MKNKKIVHVVRQFYPSVGGVENFVFNLCKKQIEFGFNVTVVTLDRSFQDNAQFVKEEVYQGIQVERISYYGSKRYPLAFFDVRKLRQYDIIHIHCVDFFLDYIILTKWLHKRPIYLHTHGGFFHTPKYLVLKNIYFWCVTKVIIKGCTKVLACSSNDYCLFKQIRKDVVHIDNGVDVEKFALVKKKRVWGNLVYFGRVDKHKRVDSLIKYVKLLIIRGYNVRLKIIGASWNSCQEGLMNEVSLLGVQDHVVFLGKVSDKELLDELSLAHLFLSASDYEGFGISAVEAMASGTVCVLNAIPSFIKIISKDNGFITNFNNEDETIKLLVKLLEFKEEKLNEVQDNARISAQKYSWNTVAKRIIDEYE
jgi:alpha-1,3-mannosyltransferase